MDVESVWIKLCPPKRPAHLVCFCCRCPQYDVTSWMNKFENQITTAYLESCQLSILGDFNIDLLVSNASTKSWPKLTENFQLHQQINGPTGVSLNSVTLVDHIFTSNNMKVRAVKVPKFGLSDHYSNDVMSFDSVIHRTKKRICIKFALCKYVANMKFAKLCNQCKGGNRRICTKTGKFGDCHLCTGCKALQISYLQHICTRQI